MSSAKFTQSILALAIVQAFAASAQAQAQSSSTQATMPEVVVSASKFVSAERASVAGFSDAPLMRTPASVVSIGREQLQDLNIRNATDATRYDASVNDSYNAVGYAEMFSIRGFMLENHSSYRKDGIAISGDTQIPIENKERFEILKGTAGLQAGVTGPGGLINYVTKRPTKDRLQSATLEVRERGTLYGALDLSGRAADPRFGYRINAAAEKLRSYVRGANGERQFVSAAFDWQITPQALLQLDMDYQHKAQLTAPGYQLISGVALPTNVDPAMLLNDQPWAKPVDTRSGNLGLRFEYQLPNDWRASITANKHSFKRDDYTAFPYGCSNEGEGFYPGYCSNGDYDVYDYQSTGEKKTPAGVHAQLQGGFSTGAIRHELTVGLAASTRSDYYGDYVYDYAGSSNIYQNVFVPPAPGNPRTGPISRRHTDKERALIVNDIAKLSSQWELQTGLRYVQVERDARPTESFLLPSVALMYSPAQDWMVYGKVAHGMEHGGEAEFGTENENETLAPSRHRQFELGAKGAVNDSLTLTAALFQITKGKEYVDDDTNIFMRGGEVTHRGLELSADGRASSNLEYSVSLIALNMQQSGSGNPGIDGKRPPNVPALKSITRLEYALPALGNMKVSGTWQYAGKKAFDEANSTFVPAYHVFGLGAAYRTRAAGMAVTVRAYIDNVADKFYWRDTTPLLGGYLIPGAPRTGGVSAQFDF